MAFRDEILHGKRLRKFQAFRIQLSIFHYAHSKFAESEKEIPERSTSSRRNKPERQMLESRPQKTRVEFGIEKKISQTSENAK